MSNPDHNQSKWSWLAPLFFAGMALVVGVIGIGWGVPSMERNRLYYSLGQDAPEVPREIVENSWKHFPEFGWLDDNKGPENLQGKEGFKRSLFNPIRSYHPDEYVVFKTLANMNPGRLDFDPKFYAWPSFFIYLVAIVLKLCSVVGLVHLTTDIKHYFQHPGDMARLYLIGRGVVVLFGMGSVAVMYLVGKKLKGARCGFVAAAVLLASPAFVVNTHYMTADLPMMCFALLTILFCLHIADKPSKRWYLLAGASAGLCAGMKYTGAVILFTLVYAHVLAWIRQKGARHKWLGLSLLLAVACFCLMNPFHILRFSKVLRILSWESEYIYQPGAQTSWLLIPGRILLCGLGVAVPFMALAGLLRFALAKRLPDLIVASGFVVYLAMAHVSSPFLRHYLVLVPFVVLLASLLVADVSNRLSSARGRRCVAIIGGLVLLVPCLPTSLGMLSDFASTNVRTRGGRFIAEHFEKGSKVAVIAEPWQFDCPPLDLQKYKLIVTGYNSDRVKNEKPNWFVGTSLQFETLYGFEGPTGDMKRFRDEVLRNEQVAKRLSFVGDGQRRRRPWPQDMRYVRPEVLIYRFDWPEEQ
ncbi:MAG: phospholipid carrier-dependent glycosyltransferase [Planctomycetes bacterium]|nr:phospholipid carrier-dependent glycosyltransferase [Planctomycetota bacterium]